MKNLYSRSARILAIFSLFVILNKSAKAQILIAGDIAFTGYTSGGPATDAFSFVLLVNIPTGTAINFTDNGWQVGNVFRSGEQTVTWTSGGAITMGNQVTISGMPAGAPTATVNGVTSGTCTGIMPSLSANGDQVLAYQGSAASPSFISGIHMNVYSIGPDCDNTTSIGWDPACTANTTNGSTKPSVLTTGVDAIWIGTEGVSASEFDNARFDGCGVPLNTPAQVRAAVNDPANWTKSDGAPAFTLPSTCNFIGITLPVTLISFTGKLNPDKTIGLQWKVAAERDILQYIVEESADGINFTKTGTVPAGTGTDYTLTDHQVFTGNNYYRLKILELSGKINYSEVIVIKLKPGIKAIAYPNPVTDKLTIQQFETVQSKTAILSDAHGKVLQHIRINSLQQQVNMETYPPGIYFLKLEEGTVFNITKVNK